MEAAHYERDYTKLYNRLVKTLPFEEAMAKAVGGDYEKTGIISANLLINKFGLREDHFIIDVGCGTGRLAWALGQQFPNIKYLGTDVVLEMLEYAHTRTPKHFQYQKITDIRIPADSASADFVVFFSVFTHLLHQESYSYLMEAKRVLKPTGKIFFSFMEIKSAWYIFEAMVGRVGTEHDLPLDMFIERPLIEQWAKHLGMQVDILGPNIPQTGAVLTF